MQTNYPNLRLVLDEAYASLSDAEIEFMFESAFGEGVTPAEYEEFFGGLAKSFSSVAGDVGRAVQKAGPGLSNIAQGAMQGAASGSALGPWGALGGALVGGTGAGLKHYGSGTTRDIGGALGSVVGAAGQLTGRGAMAGTAGSLLGMGQQALAGQRPGAGQLLGLGSQLLGQRSPAAAQLLGLLGRPEMRQAIGSLAAGRNPGIPLGDTGQRIPAAALAGLLGALGREAEADMESDEWGENVPAYLVDANGQLVVDPRQPHMRAARVLQLVHEAVEAESDEYWSAREAIDEFDEFDDSDDAYGDSIEWWAA